MDDIVRVFLLRRLPFPRLCCHYPVMSLFYFLQHSNILLPPTDDETILYLPIAAVLFCTAPNTNCE